MSMASEGLVFGARPSPLAQLLHWRQAWLTMDRNRKVIAQAQTRTGIAMIHVAFLTLLLASGQASKASVALIAATLIACALWPAGRLRVVAGASLLYFSLKPFRTDGQAALVENLRAGTAWTAELPALAFQIPMAMGFLALVYALLLYQRDNRSGLLNRRPVFTLLFILGGAVAAANIIPAGTAPHALLWTWIAMLAASFFFIGYAMHDQRGKGQTPNLARTAYSRPFWGGPSVPFKGPAFLTKHEALSDEALAVTRLKGLKLIAWATILAGLHLLFSKLIHQTAELPTLNQALAATASGKPFSLATNWLSTLAYFALELAAFAALYHTLVAVVRMTGYCIPRGMARPLSARSIAEFWNRYVFYFKEILVDFFFYPAFARYFKKYPRLRLAFATFAAAFFGNVLFSVISHIDLFATKGPVDAILTFRNYMFYGLLLAGALVISQLKKSRPKPEYGFVRYEVLPRIGVISFFCLIQIFDDEAGYLTVEDRIAFFAQLFGA